MHLSRLLLLSLMVPLCVLPVGAQSASSPAPAIAPLFGGHTPPADSRTRIPALTIKPVEEANGSQAQSPLDLSRLSQFQIAANTRVEGSKLGAIAARGPGSVRNKPQVQDPRSCYSMRNYRFERDHPGSDSTTLKDYSVCQLVSQFQAKNIVVSPMPMLSR